MSNLSRLTVARWTPVPLRLIVGYGFIAHGFAKVSKGPDSFADILHALGVPGPHFMAWATIVVEILGGLAVILGAFVTAASLPMITVLLVATFSVHLPYGFSSIKLIGVTAAGARFGPPGYETDLLYIACLGALVLGGCGPWLSIPGCNVGVWIEIPRNVLKLIYLRKALQEYRTRNGILERESTST